MTKEGFELLKHQLRRDEGSRLHSYRDVAGNLTIGVGHNIDAHGIAITPEQEDQLLNEDVARAMAETLAYLPWVQDLDEPRQRVIFNMAFNLGTVGLLSFHHTIAEIHKRDFQSAAASMLNSRWARQVGNRAIRLADTMRSGVE